MMKIPFLKKNESSDNNKTSLFSSFNGVLVKLTCLFDPTPQKEKVLKYEDINRAGDTYYANVAVGYKISQRVTVLLMILFLTISLFTNFKDITYDNFFYLLKDFSAAVDFESSNYDTLAYNSDQRHFFSLYRGGLAIADPSGISVFTATGRQTLRTNTPLSAPCIESSGKYFVVYDTAGDSISVYNAFARIYSESFGYPVTKACFSDDGKMAIVTKDISHRSLVHIYNKDFDKLFTVPSDKYVFDMCFDSAIDSLVICYYDIGNGSGVSELSVRKLDSPTNESHRIYIDGEFLLKCGYIDNGRLAVITDKAIRLFDEELQEYDSFSYVNSEVSGFCINEYGVTVSYISSSQNAVVVFNSQGHKIYGSVVNDTVKDVYLCERFAFLRTDMGVWRIDTSDTSQQFLPSDQGKMVVYNSNTALVCGESKAEYLVFEE